MRNVITLRLAIAKTTYRRFRAVPAPNDRDAGFDLRNHENLIVTPQHFPVPNFGHTGGAR
jgi:hypothetical protein